MSLSRKKQKREILLIGGGGHCRSVLSSLLVSGEIVAGIIDKQEKGENEYFGIPVLGTDEELNTFLRKGFEVLITVGSVKDNRLRSELFEKVRSLGFRMATFIAKTSIFGKGVTVDEGTVVLEGTIISSGTRVGKNCIVNTGAIVEHDVIIGDHVHVSSGVRISGGVRVGDMSFIGVNTTVIQGIHIGSRSVIGAGAVVLEDVPDGVIIAGCPAKIIKENT